MSEDCPHCVFEKTEANCPGCFEGSHYRPKPMTNADRIRAMSDEELAQFIWNRDIDIVEKASVAGQFTFTVDREKCFKNVLEWLKKEVEE